MRGILHAGGGGEQSKSRASCNPGPLVSVHGKPMIHYPLSVLLHSGIRDILVIARVGDVPLLQKQLGDGQNWGIRLSYAIQSSPLSSLDAVALASEFIGMHPISLVMSGLFLYGEKLSRVVHELSSSLRGAATIVCPVYGKGNHTEGTFFPDEWISESKKKVSPSGKQYSLTGLYYFDETVTERVRNLRSCKSEKPDIRDLIRSYFVDGRCDLLELEEDMVCLDMSTSDKMSCVEDIIQSVETDARKKNFSLEEICWRMGFIDYEQMKELARGHVDGETGRYLLEILEKYS